MCTELCLRVSLTVGHTYMTRDSGLLARVSPSSPMDTYRSDCGEVAEEREASESAALSEGHDDEEI